MLISAVPLEGWPAQECRWSPLTACIMGPLLGTTILGSFFSYQSSLASSGLTSGRLLSFASRREFTVGALITLAMTGVLGETANVIRLHAGTGLVLFALVLAVGAYQVRPIGRIILVVTLLLGVAGAALVFRHIYAQRDAFLQRQPG